MRTLVSGWLLLLAPALPALGELPPKYLTRMLDRLEQEVGREHLIACADRDLHVVTRTTRGEAAFRYLEAVQEGRLADHDGNLRDMISRARLAQDLESLLVARDWAFRPFKRELHLAARPDEDYIARGVQREPGMEPPPANVVSVAAQFCR